MKKKREGKLLPTPQSLFFHLTSWRGKNHFLSDVGHASTIFYSFFAFFFLLFNAKRRWSFFGLNIDKEAGDIFLIVIINYCYHPLSLFIPSLTSYFVAITRESGVGRPRDLKTITHTHNAHTLHGELDIWKSWVGQSVGQSGRVRA